jgi:hypothetical protein
LSQSLLVLVLLGGNARARDETTSAAAQDEPTSAPAQDESISASAQGESVSTSAQDDSSAASSTVQIQGFIDASVFVPASGFSDRDQELSLGVDQVELDIIGRVSAELLIRSDWNVFPTEIITFDDLLEQAYAEYFFAGKETGAFVRIGKSVAPIGIEALDPTDMYQYSNGLLFTYATPAALTGIFGGYVGDSYTVMLWASNDWDSAKKPDKPNVGGRLEYRFDGGHIGLSSTYEPVSLSPSIARLMVDLDARYQLGSLTAFLEGNYGSFDGDSSTGVLTKVNYALNDLMSLTARWDWYDQQFSGAEIDNAMSVTAAGLFALAAGLSGTLEYRIDFLDGEHTTSFAAVELIGAF